MRQQSGSSGDGRRVQKVEREVQQTIAKYLIHGFKTPLPGLVTVARVIMPGDLRTAKVYVSVLGGDVNAVVEILQERAFEVQDFINRELRMRYCPKLKFFSDHTTDQILKIEGILRDLDKEKQSSSDSEDSSDDTQD